MGKRCKAKGDRDDFIRKFNAKYCKQIEAKYIKENGGYGLVGIHLSDENKKSIVDQTTLYFMLWHEVDNTLETMPEHVKSAEHHAMLRDSFCENFEKDVYESYLSANDGKPKIDKLWIRNQIQW